MDRLTTLKEHKELLDLIRDKALLIRHETGWEWALHSMLLHVIDTWRVQIEEERQNYTEKGKKKSNRQLSANTKT